MRIAITGEQGFIAKNLISALSKKNQQFISLINAPQLPVVKKTNEPCIYGNTEEHWTQALLEHEIDILIHNAAVVGTDVVALQPDEALKTNLLGTEIICRAAKAANISVCYMGTSVIYDTKKYQNAVISENSDLGPYTMYGAQKLAAEFRIKAILPDWMIIRPLFAYGGTGDMNSLIAKSMYASLKGKQVDMFLNPNLVKDYLHVEDYCDAVVDALDRPSAWNNEFNISAENPQTVQNIVDMISTEIGSDLNRIIKWHPETDYLGNHLLSSEKYRKLMRWTPKISLHEGIKKSWHEIQNSTDYDPMKYLDEAKAKNIDLTKFF